ncbi:MAG: nucleotidyltransferase domain-containing protein [Paludibacter sp.]|nr:nucleotidyltransferase domain-containing protein [Paludibacter sp.]
MRINNKIITFLKSSFSEKTPEAKLYLFGSRIHDDAQGGDIDVMIISDTLIEKRMIRNIRVEFYKKFGWQKIDLVNFTFSDTSVFKQLVEKEAIEL